MINFNFSKPKISKKYEENSWSSSHLSCPSPIYIEERKIIRIYYTSISDQQQGSISYYDVHEDDPTNIISDPSTPIFTKGEKGQFDDNGVFAVSAIYRNGLFELYYIGFELSNKIKYKIFSGCATSKDGINFKRISKTPILDRVDGQSFFRGGPFVYEKNESYKMLYVGGESWIKTPMGEKPEYNIYEASEKEKFKFNDYRLIKKFDYSLDEHGFGRPIYFEINNESYLFYSTRSVSNGKYRLDGENSQSGEKVTFELLYKSTNLDELCYFTPIKVKDKIYAFFNDENFGESKIFVTEILG